tara:strand:- start:404 stop:535 length:132 start_codon:yes stop_codon:yes gene_type:complete
MKYENINTYKLKSNVLNFEPTDDDLKQIEKEVEILFIEGKNEN